MHARYCAELGRRGGALINFQTPHSSPFRKSTDMQTDLLPGFLHNFKAYYCMIRRCSKAYVATKVARPPPGYQVAGGSRNPIHDLAATSPRCHDPWETFPLLQSLQAMTERGCAHLPTSDLTTSHHRARLKVAYILEVKRSP